MPVYTLAGALTIAGVGTHPEYCDVWPHLLGACLPSEPTFV